MTYTRQKIARPTALRPIIEQLPALWDDHVNRVGFVAGAGLYDTRDEFPGGSLYQSIDDGITYKHLLSLTGRAATGRVVGTLGGEVCSGSWDEVNTLTVELDHDDDELSSSTDEEVLRGIENLLLVGREIIGFSDALLVGTRRYDLTRLLRGRRGTEPYIDRHAEGERVLVLTGSSVVFVELGLVAHHTPLLLKLVPAGLTVDDVPEQVRLTVESESLKPPGPVLRPGERDGSGNLTISWIRRARRPFRLLSGVIAPVEETPEVYEVDILNDARTTVLRTLTATGATSVEYSAAQQATDFGSTHDPVQLNVYQLSNVVGRGHVTEGDA